MSKLTKADAYEYKHQKIADEYELEPNPAPSPKYKALSGIPRIPNLCGATQSFLECIVELAHDHWGFAFPSRKYIQLWTGRSRWAIDRAHAKAEQLGLVATVERRMGKTGPQRHRGRCERAWYLSIRGQQGSGEMVADARR
jgi:hypothetical protein